MIGVRTRTDLKGVLMVFLVAVAVTALIGIFQTASGGRLLTGQGVFGNLRYLGIFPPYPADTMQEIRDTIGKPSTVTHLRLAGQRIFRAHGAVTRHGYFSVFMVIGIALAAAFYRANPQRSAKLIFGLLCLVFAGGLFGSFSRTSWLVALLIITVVPIVSRAQGRLRSGASRAGRSIMAIGLAVAFVALLVLAGLTIGPDFVKERALTLMSPTQTSGFTSRDSIWQTSLQRIGDRPLFGYGRRSVEGAVLHGGKVVTSHNIFLDVAHDRGIVALFLWLALWVAFMMDALRAYSRSQQTIYRGLFGGIALGLIAFILSGLTRSPALYPETAALYWLLAGLLESAILVRYREERFQQSKDRVHPAVLRHGAWNTGSAAG
jgi:O-antigen ligase